LRSTVPAVPIVQIVPNLLDGTLMTCRDSV
jgi:hypothetical protein